MKELSTKHGFEEEYPYSITVLRWNCFISVRKCFAKPDVKWFDINVKKAGRRGGTGKYKIYKAAHGRIFKLAERERIDLYTHST